MIRVGIIIEYAKGHGKYALKTYVLTPQIVRQYDGIEEHDLEMYVWRGEGVVKPIPSYYQLFPLTTIRQCVQRTERIPILEDIRPDSVLCRCLAVQALLAMDKAGQLPRDIRPAFARITCNMSHE